MFQPTVLSPTPDPAFVCDLKRIDPELRVIWGYERYLKNCWAIEHHMEPDRYFECYASLLESKESRFIDQPIFDTAQPLYAYVMNEETLELELTQMGYKQVGTRKFDLAPEWEWIQFVQEKDGSFRPLDSRTIMDIKRTYAWHRNQPLSRIRFEQEQEREAKEKALQAKRVEEGMSAIPEIKRMFGKTLFGSAPTKVMEGTDLG